MTVFSAEVVEHEEVKQQARSHKITERSAKMSPPLSSATTPAFSSPPAGPKTTHRSGEIDLNTPTLSGLTWARRLAAKTNWPTVAAKLSRPRCGGRLGQHGGMGRRK